MTDLIVFSLLVVLVLLGPLAYFFGADSRVDEPRAGWPGTRR
jgi:hypothetical protein